MLNSLLHGQPLMAGMLGCNDNVYIVLASDTVIEAGKQTVCIGGKIHTDNICLLVGNMIQETGILVRKSVVVLLPYIGGKNQVQGSDFLSPGKLVANLQPLCMLSTHGVYNTDECFIGSEEAMTTGKQIAFQPALAHMLGQVGVHNSSVVCQILVLFMIIAVPITLGLLEYLVETVGHGLIRSKDTEVLCILIQFEDITDEAAQLNHILLFNSTGLGYVYRVITEVRQTEVTKKLTTVCMRIRTDSSVSLRSNITKSLNQTTILIKELFRMIAQQPLLQHIQMLRLLHGDRYLMCTEGGFYRKTVNNLGTGPALGGTKNDHGPEGSLVAAVLSGILLDCLNLTDTLINSLCHQLMHGHGIAALYEIRLPSIAVEQAL